jgi:hypothetical protein
MESEIKTDKGPDGTTSRRQYAIHLKMRRLTELTRENSDWRKKDLMITRGGLQPDRTR